MAEWLTPKTSGLEVRGSSLTRRVVSFDRELYSTLSLFTQVYKWVPATYCWGVTLRWTSIFSRQLAFAPLWHYIMMSLQYCNLITTGFQEGK